MGEPGDPIELLVDRLAVVGLPEPVCDLVLAAAMGDEELTAALGGDRPARPPVAASEPTTTAAMFLSRIAVTGFRGVAGETFLGLRPGPGLTLVVGRNGSGKSSFAEAAELAFTGTSSRWKGRSRVWETGWANLHHRGDRSIEVRIVVEGQPGETIVRRSWSGSAGLCEGQATAQLPSQPVGPVQALGLDSALSTWRPFLSYNELGGLLDEGPSRLYDAISGVLGLEEWVEAEQRLTSSRKPLEAAAKNVRAEADRLRGLLNTSHDERAAVVLAALPARKAWDLDTVERLSMGQDTPGTEHAALERLAAMPQLDLDDVSRRATALRQALVTADATSTTEAGRARDLADLLDRALQLHRHQPDATCPVCGTSDVLDMEWADHTAAEITRLRHDAIAADHAAKDLANALASAQALVASLPPPRLGTHVAGVDTEGLMVVWQRWAVAPDGPGAGADHIEMAGIDLAAALLEVREAATAELQRRADAWRPIAAQLAAWVPTARVVQATQGPAGDLKAAASWLADETTAVRNERFAPIADRVKEIWEELRFTSNVSLDAVTLEGAKTRRRVELSVAVDGVAGAALSVMSQGELHALALSLFLPRATLPESPFRFLVVDDPVQAMDANRVDGLARVLAGVAKSHQVVVFTHDERLPDAARRLGIAATVLEVARGQRSELTVRARRNPVDDYLDDARAVLATADYPEEARRRVVPGLCRNALEAACIDTTRRRLLLRGRAHAQIDLELDRAGKLLQRLSLALFCDVDRAGEVLGEVNRRWGRAAGDCIQALQRGTHVLIDEHPRELVGETERVAHGIVGLP